MRDVIETPVTIATTSPAPSDLLFALQALALIVSGVQLAGIHLSDEAARTIFKAYDDQLRPGEGASLLQSLIEARGSTVHALSSAAREVLSRQAA